MRLLVHGKLLPQGQILEREISASHERRSQRIYEDSEPFEHSSEVVRLSENANRIKQDELLVGTTTSGDRPFRYTLPIAL